MTQRAKIHASGPHAAGTQVSIDLSLASAAFYGLEHNLQALSLNVAGDRYEPAPVRVRHTEADAGGDKATVDDIFVAEHDRYTFKPRQKDGRYLQIYICSNGTYLTADKEV